MDIGDFAFKVLPTGSERTPMEEDLGGAYVSQLR